MKATLSILFSVCMLMACMERDANIDPPSYQSKLVVNALLNNQEEFRIQVSSSVPALSQREPDYLDDAIIELRADGVLTDPFTFDPFNDVYELAEKPQPGVRYDLVVTHPDRGGVTASTTLPLGVGLGNLNYIDSVGLDSSNTNLAELSFDLSDPAGDANYYRLSMLYYSAALQDFLPFQFSTDDAVLLSPETVRLDDGSFQFSDRLFNGQSRKIRVQFSASLATNSPRYLVKIEALSEDFYKYVNSIELYDQSGNNPLREPVFIHSNVSGGLGIFAGALILQDTLY